MWSLNPRLLRPPSERSDACYTKLPSGGSKTITVKAGGSRNDLGLGLEFNTAMFQGRFERNEVAKLLVMRGFAHQGPQMFSRIEFGGVRG